MCAFRIDDMKSVAPEPEKKREGIERTHSFHPGLAEIASQSKPGGSYSPVVLAGLVRLVEFAILLAAGLLLHKLYVGSRQEEALDYYVATPAMAAGAVIALQSFGLYTTASLRAPLRHGLRLAAGWSVVFVITLAALFFLKLDGVFSRVWLMGWYASGLALLAVERTMLAILTRRLTRSGRLDRRTVIVGGGKLADPVLRALAAQEDGDLRILGLFDDRADERSPDVVAGYPKLGTVDDLVELARHARMI